MSNCSLFKAGVHVCSMVLIQPQQTLFASPCSSLFVLLPWRMLSRSAFHKLVSNKAEFWSPPSANFWAEWRFITIMIRLQTAQLLICLLVWKLYITVAALIQDHWRSDPACVHTCMLTPRTRIFRFFWRIFFFQLQSAGQRCSLLGAHEIQTWKDVLIQTTFWLYFF